MRQRFLGLATGASPAFVKVVGFAGGGSARRLVSYISRSGETRIENERGDNLHGAAVPVQVAGGWSDRMPPRNQKPDMARFEIEVSWRTGMPPLSGDHLVRQAFSDRAFAFAILQTSDITQVSGIVVLHSVSEGRLFPDGERADAIRRRVVNAIGKDAEAVQVRFDSHGHGTRWGAAALRGLVEQFPDQVRDDRNELISTDQAASRLVQTDWRRLLASQAPRDTLHLVISAGDRYDLRQFEDSVRDFLKQEFRGHRYVFAVHDPQHDPKPHADGGKRRHLHAHAIVATRSDFDDRLNVWVTDLNRWRETISETARGNGINLEMVVREETASSRAYTHTQVRPVSFVGRTEYEGTSPAAQRLYAAKRSDQPVAASGEVKKARAKVARQTWEDLTRPTYSEPVRAYAQRMLARFDEAERLANGQVAEASKDVSPTAGAPPGKTGEPRKEELLAASNASEPLRTSVAPPMMAKGRAATVEPSRQVVSMVATERSSLDGDYRILQHPANSTPAETEATIRARENRRSPGGPSDSDAEGPSSLGLAALSLVAAFKQARASNTGLDAFEVDDKRFQAKQRLERQLIRMGDANEGRAGTQAGSRPQAQMADAVERSNQGEQPTPMPGRMLADAKAIREAPKESVREKPPTDRSRPSGRNDYER